MAIFPSSMSVDDITELIKCTESKPLSMPPLNMIYTGPICSINEVNNLRLNVLILMILLMQATSQMIDTAQIFASNSDHLNRSCNSGPGLCPPVRFAAVASAVADSYYTNNWSIQESKLLALASADVCVDGLTKESSCLRNVMTYPCSPWDNTFVESKVKDALPTSHFLEVERILAQKYARMAAATSPPSFVWEMGFTKLFFVQPSCKKIPQKASRGQIHVSFLPSVIDRHTENKLSNKCNHIVLLLRSPADLMKHPSQWNDDDFQEKPMVLTEVKPREKTAVLRGKHEILYGAHSGTPDTDSQLAWAKTWTNDEIRKGGDIFFNKAIRSLHRWLTSTPAGSRRVTLVSCRWSAGMDFDLCLDGDRSKFISHVSLEPTGMNPECTAILDRMRNSFQDGVILETGPLVSASRAVLVDVMCSDGTPSACQFEEVSQKNDVKLLSVPQLHRQLDLNGCPKIIYLSSDEVCIELNTSGSGYICCTLYEVPCLVGYADVHRIVETELSSLYILKKLSNRFIGNGVSSKFIFRDLSPFSAYCIVITKSSDDPSTRPDTPEPLFRQNGILNTPSFVHFRTLSKPENSVSTCLLAGVLDGDVKCASTAIVRIKEQLDGNGRPLAAPVYLFHNRLEQMPGSIESIDRFKVSQSNSYSEEMRDLFRMAMTIHIGENEMTFSHGKIDIDARSSYDHHGTVHLSSNGKFARIGLTMNTTKSLNDLSNCVQTLRRRRNVTNITVFVSKPLVHHMEHIIVGSKNWVKSKHFDKKNYFPALTKALHSLKLWKKEEHGRDVQIICVANVSCPRVTYFHSAGKKNTPETGYRHIILPLYLNQSDDVETIAVPCGTFKMDSKLYYSTYTYNKGTRESDLRRGTPFQIIQPRYHLHGYPDPKFSEMTQNVSYKVSVFTADENGLTVGNDARVVHNHVTVKAVVSDIDNLELILGPVVGQVTNASVSIIFEVNRSIDVLLCAIRPVGNPKKLMEIKQRAIPYYPVVYEFEDLESDQVYDILIPELHGQSSVGKFRSLSSSATYSEVAFIGDEHLENFPMSNKLIEELLKQQVINFEELRAVSFVRQYEKESRQAAGVDTTLDKDDPVYRRPWICLSERMKALACTTSTVFHLGSHALFSRLLRHIIPPLVQLVKKYNIDLEKYEKSSAVSKFFQMQLNQTIEDSLRLVWTIEPVIRDVFRNSSNIPLYNSEYWLSENNVWGPDVGIVTDRDIVALEKIRSLYSTNLEKFIYPLKKWRKKAKNHFHTWKEGPMTVITLDQTSEQAKYYNSKVVSAANTALGRIAEEGDEDNSLSRKKIGKNKNNANEVKAEEDVVAKTYDASFMSEHQWKQIRTTLMEKDTKQLVICMQFPIIPMEVADSDNNSQAPSEYASNLSWTPKEEDISKFLGQLLKWIMPKKGKRSGKTLCFVCVSNRSYVTNIQEMKSGIKIQQMCLGKFSCVKESFGRTEAVPLVPSTFKMKGKIGTWKYQHRFVCLDEITIDSDYCGSGGVYAGRAVMNHQPYSATFGILKFWFDSWKPTGVWNFNTIRAIGPPEEKLGDALMVVGPIIGAPRTQYVEDNRTETTMTVPFLFELDRKANITCVATDLFSGKQIVIKQEVLKHRPTVFRLTDLSVDTRYTVDFVEGIQNAFASRFVVQTNVNWDDTNIIIFNVEHKGKKTSELTDSTYIKEISDRFRIPFHGIACAVHCNCSVDVNSIFDEVEFMPELKELLVKVKSPTTDEKTRTEIVDKLRKLVSKIMDRVRVEYRNYFSKPSYKELLNRGYHLFMGRDTYKEAEATDTDPPGSLMALLRLISSRINQEYFDQLVAAEDEVFSAWPRIEYTAEMIKKKKEEEERKRQEQQQIEEGEEPLELPADENNPDGIRLCTLDDYLDNHILNVPLKRRPFRTFFDNAQDPLDCVLFQWMQNFVPPPFLWKPYVTPNQKVTIESFCTCDDNHIRDIHERIVNSEVHSGARLIIMPNVGPLMNAQSLLGYKMSQWTRRWVKEGVDRNITLVCPAKDTEGTYNYSMTFGAWPDPVVYARAKPKDIPPALEGTLNIQTLNSIFYSNEKEISRIKKEKVDEIKAKTKPANQSKAVVAKKKKEEAALKEQLKVELQQIFQSMTPDGFVVYENRTASVKGPFSIGGTQMTITYTELKTVGTKLDKSLPADGYDTSSKPYDYIHLPEWITKFVPASPGVFVQDEVNIVMRQEPHTRKVLDIIETDESIVRNCKKIYLSSRLSELSRPEDMREYDMELEGIKEMFLEEVISRVWREAIPAEVKSRLLTLTDDYVRAICVRRAFPDIEKDLSTPINFCKAVRRLVLASAQMFLAFKMSKMERWRYILDIEEFPDDTDQPYISEDEDSDVETKDDATELTTKGETETKMSESVAELRSHMESEIEQKSVVDGSLQLLSVDGGADKKTVGDTSTVEGLFERTMDNVSNAPKSESNEEQTDPQEEKPDENKEAQKENEDIKEAADNKDDKTKDEAPGKEDQIENIDDNVKKEEEGKEEAVEVDEDIPPEDRPPTDCEKVALKQADVLYNTNWRRLEKRRLIGSNLSYMSTNHLS